MDFIKNKKVLVMIGILAIVIITAIYYIVQPKENYIELESIVEEANNIQVEEVETKKIKIHIAGYVVDEGIIEIEEGARIADVIDKARRINLWRRYNKSKLSI